MNATDKRFSITAKTYTLKCNNQEGEAIILDNKTKYVVPIYQRPYSWTEEQLRKFISDIFSSFFGADDTTSEEPMFIGTMQLSYKNSKNEQEIIDGQQRLTTLLLFIKVLKCKYPSCEELNNIEINCLSTKVNKGTQQDYLNEAIYNNLSLDTINEEKKKDEKKEKELNPYLQNIYIINRLIDDTIEKEENNLEDYISKFIEYLLSNVYFVIIETRAGLSKTLQIFNAINTTGLDLNGGDIFKIRMYEYLTNIKGKDDNSFDKINDLYNTIDKKNSELGSEEADIRGILHIYQYILIAKYKLPVVLYKDGVDTFFERLFDTIFMIHQWEHFKNKVDSVELTIEDIDRIIEIRYEWENRNYKTCEDAFAFYFIHCSRYSKYWILIFIFLYRFKDDENYWENMLLFTRQLSKLYIIYSICYLKSITEIHSLTHSLVKKIITSSYNDVMLFMSNKSLEIKQFKKHDLEIILDGNIVYNAKMKNIICRLSAMLDEDYQTEDQNQIKDIIWKRFNNDVDIEHIQPYHDNDKNLRENIWKEWGENINSIGNLIVLEKSINRSISNKSYNDKCKDYSKSKFSIVKKQCENYQDWSLEKCIERKDKEKRKILDYLFDSISNK